MSFRVTDLKSRVHSGVVTITKGHNYVKTVRGSKVVFSPDNLIMLYICTKFRANISKGFRVIEQILFAY